MSEPAGVETTDGPAPSREDLEALTKAELAETYNVSDSLSKAEMVDAVLNAYGVPTPKAGEVILAVDGLTSDEHYYDISADPITRDGTAVPASRAEEIIAQAALGGVRIREVN